MDFFEIEGTSLLDWWMAVAAQNEEQAVGAVRERIDACVGPGPGAARIAGLDRRTIRAAPAELEESLH